MICEGKYLTPKASADYIGYSLSGFKKLLSRGVIPFTKPAGRVYIKKLDLDLFVENRL